MTKPRIVYHGTGGYALDGFLKNPPEKRRRSYVRKPCFCTTHAFSVAATFASRKSSFDDFRNGVVSGVVLEFELTGRDGVDYAAADGGALQDEREIAVFNINRLRLVAVWRHDESGWQRHVRPSRPTKVKT